MAEHGGFHLARSLRKSKVMENMRWEHSNDTEELQGPMSCMILDQTVIQRKEILKTFWGNLNMERALNIRVVLLGGTMIM